MGEVLVPMAVVGVLGLVLGGMLGVANCYLKVEVDPRIEELTAMLPGYNCGSCGFAGCSGLAEDLIKNGGNSQQCKPCQAQMKEKINEYLNEMRKRKT